MSKTDGPGARLPGKAGRKPSKRTTAQAAHSTAQAATRSAGAGKAKAAPTKPKGKAAKGKHKAKTASAKQKKAAAGKQAARQAVDKQAAGPAAKADKAAKPAANQPVGGDAQRMSFFETGEQLNQDFELQMPDPNKHKPTKEEYQNLLQEFSVMFRLDKRSKRQKVLITVVLAGLLVGVIAFGVILYLQGQQRQALLRDSKTILAVFALPYQQNADFDPTPEEDVAEGSAIKKKKVVSILASELLTKNKARITAARAKRKTKSGAMRIAGGGSHILVKKYTTAEKKALEAKRKAAIAAALGGGYGGKSERVVKKHVLGAKKLSRSELRRLCSAKAADLRACGQAVAGGAAFKAKLHISKAGTIDRVTCRVEGKINVKLSACAEGKFSRVRKPPQPEPISYTCAVSGN